MRSGLPDRQQQRFEQRAALMRQAYAAPPPLTPAERAAFCGCGEPAEQHGEGYCADEGRA